MRAACLRRHSFSGIFTLMIGTKLLRPAILAGIVATLFLLIVRWGEFQDKKAELAEAARLGDTSANSASINLDAELPNGVNNTTQADQSAALEDNALELPAAEAGTVKQAVPSIEIDTSQLITVQTDALKVHIDPKGGDIVRTELLRHTRKLGGDEPLVLLNRAGSRIYTAQSGLMGANGIDNTGARPIYQSAQQNYVLSGDTLDVDLLYKQGDISFIKRFSFAKDQYLIGIRYLINNQSQTAWTGNMFGIIKRDDSPPPAGAGVGLRPYFGAAISTNDKNYLEVKFDDIIDDGSFTERREGGWIALAQHYFISAWIPEADEINRFEISQSKSKQDLFQLSFVGETKVAPAGGQIELGAGFYTGPKDINRLEKISPHLDLTIDYSFLWFLAKPMFKVLSFIHGFVGNWGIAIIIFTALIKLLFLYPSAVSYRSMARMKKFQPKMAQLRERYGDDRQKMSAELMKLYKDEKVNPLGGCLPIVLQMPFFLAFYWVLMESVELRHASFLWINDLSARDPLFILPLLMGSAMFLQQKLQPTPTDPTQAKVMKMLPIIFTALFLFFPAGLVLYWTVNNILSMTQQFLITKQIERNDAKSASS